MSDETANVDWSLLPHAPLAFFGLSEAFDRTELKRAYNRFLRQFKPEKHPQEFQRIRAAYELLDNQLRYGAAAMPAPEYRWQTDVGAATAPAPERQREPAMAGAAVPAKPAPLPLYAQIRQVPLAQVYRELAEKQHKLPYEFYALAVMSDVVHRKDGQQFLRWLLQGLSEHRHDRALLSLLYEYLRAPLPIEHASRLLAAISKTVRTDEFFPLTESLWHRLLRERPFAEFRQTLEACESNLRDVGIDSRLAFTIEILKGAIWVADAAWIDRAFTFIQENFQRVGFHLQNDLDLLEFLQRYINGRPALAKASPLRRQIDEALREFFSGEQATRDRAVLKCQVRIASDPTALLEAFPVKSEEDYSNFYLLWSYVSADVGERHAAERAPANVSQWMSRGRALFENIERRVKGSLLYRRWLMARVAYIVALCVAYFSSMAVLHLFWGLVTAGQANAEIPGGIALALSVTGIAIVFGIHLYFVRPRWRTYAQREFTRQYAEISRGELAAFLQRSNFAYEELRELLFNSDVSNLTTAQSTADHFQGDYALAIYAIALRFQL